MAENFKKSYRFAYLSSLYITLLLTLVLSVFLYFQSALNAISIMVFLPVSYAVCFFIIQYRVEKFIYRRVRKIYDDIEMLEMDPVGDSPVTTDMRTLIKEVEKFAKNRKKEIETLKIREDYRKEFMGNVSHELKTPLFTVQGYLLTLLDGAMKDKKILKKYLERANKGVERLIYIVKDLDMITKLEVGDLNLNYTNFDIVELIQSVFDLYEMKAAKKKIILTFDMHYQEPIMVHADKERIQQVLSNLVVNSIKYGKEDGTTEVSIEDLVKSKVIVRVTDNGEGIAQSHIPRLFERFYRVDKSGSRKEGGSGLGLAIVKHIIEAHHERIYVESDYRVGSEFSFTLEKVKKFPVVDLGTETV
ncbi:sensor histidine kinase [Aquimarina brevivitae]|uniref:histidine kinase n=1 Tax=Aquimarina brevivitae TaxID=323412 RepID=A0A4Q7PI63_9FLAO|nr:ATP-binding protein [Aquimarina brevivitae]RZS99658.1 two-component system phosphate regulon sensor histidine kinase PhoR [Aquimarina brevivitae]